MPRTPVVPVFTAVPPASPAAVGSSDAPNRPPTVGADYSRKSPPPPSQPPAQVITEQSGLGWKWHTAAIGLLMVLIFAAYGNSFQSQWVLDNKYIIELDPRTKATTWNDATPTQGSANKPGVRNIFTQDYWWPKGISGLYRPITSFSYWLNWTVFGNGHHRTEREQVVGFHWVNLGIHALNAVLVYFLLLRLVRRFWVSFFTAALFATHPIATESVTNIIGRADMLAATTIVGGLLLYIRAAGTVGWRKVGVLMALLLLTMFGVFSKESAGAIVIVAMAYDVIYRLGGRIRQIDWREVIIAVSRGVTIGLMAFFAISIYLVVLVPWMGEMNDTQATYQYSGDTHPGPANLGFDNSDVGVAKSLYLSSTTGEGKSLAEQIRIWLPVKSIAADGQIKIAKTSDPDQAITFNVNGTLNDQLPWSQLTLSDESGKLDLKPSDVLVVTFVSRGFAWLLTGTICGLLLIFTSTALLALRSFWWPMAAAVGGAVILLSLAAAYQPHADTQPPGPALLLCRAHLVQNPDTPDVKAAAEQALKDQLPNPVVKQLQHVTITGLSIATLLFVLVEALFAFAWRDPPADTADERSLAWRGFFDGYYVMLGVAVMLMLVRDWVFANSTPPEEPFLDNPLRGLGFFAARLTAMKVWGLLFCKLIWPVTLSCDYSYNQIPLFGYTGVTFWQNFQCILWLVLLLGIVALAIWLGFRGQRAICFFIFLYLINYVPTSNWPIIIGSVMAERFMYLPLIGFVGILVIGVDMIAKRVVGRLDDQDSIIPMAGAVATNAPAAKPVTPPLLQRFGIYRYVPHMLLAALMILYGVRAFYRNMDWRTDVTLWESAQITSPISFRSYQSLAFALFEQDPPQGNSPGNIDRMVKIDEAGLRIVDSLEDKDNSSRLYLHLGMYYAGKASTLCKYDDKGQAAITPDARDWMVKAIYILERAEPIDRAFNQINRERDLKRGGKIEEQFDVGLPQIYEFLGNDYMTLGMTGQAEQAFEYMRQLGPTDPQPYFKIAQAQLAENHADLAAVACMQVIVLDNSRMDAWQLLYSIYQKMNTGDTPCIVGGPGGHPMLNLNHPLVRDNMVDVYRGFVRVFRQANRKPLVQTAIANAEAKKYPANLFDEVLNEPITIPAPPPPIYYKPGTKSEVPGGMMP